MTRQQMDLLIEYINIKCDIARKCAKGEGISYHSADRLVDIISELEDTTPEGI